MMFFSAELRHILRAGHSKKAAALMILGLLTLAGVFMMAEAFHHHGSSTVTNGTTTDSAQCTPSPGSTLDDFSPIESASTSTKATFYRRGDEARGDREVNSIHVDAFGRPSEEPFSTSVTTINPVTVACWSTTASPRAATTFKTIFTTTIFSEASTALPIINSVSTIMDFLIAPLSERLSRLNGEKLPPPTLTRSFTGTRPLSLASHRYSEAGIFSTTTMSVLRIVTYDPSPSSVSLTKEPDGMATIAIVATTEIAAASTSLSIVTPAILSSTTQSLPIGYGGSMFPPAATSHLTSSDTILISSTTVMVEASKTSRIQDAARPSSEAQTPHNEGQPLPPSYNPFLTTGLAPSGSLTALASALSSTPTQGVPSTPLSSIVAAISSVATTAAAVTSASISLSLTGPSTQLQTVQPTSSPTATPLVEPSSDSKKKLTIALSVCIPILVVFAVFIAIWQRIRYVEKKRADDLEKDIIWVTPRPHTPRTSKENRTPRRDRVKGTRSVGSTPSTLARPDPTFMDGLNDVERAMVEEYQKKVAEVNARKAAATLSSARSPAKAAQRRSGGPMMRQGLDGTNDAPLLRRPSQIFTHHEDSLLNPLSDTNEIGIAPSSAPDERNSHIRNALECFQPMRLSTITDKSGEIEMSEISAPFGGAGSGPINQGGDVKGRLLERFIMKRKGLMPLDG